MRRLAFLGVVALVAVSGMACNDATEGKEFFEAVLTGAEEVPARGTAAHGRAQLYVDGNTISYAIELDDASNITAAHIHTAAAGVNGPVRLFLFPFPGSGATSGNYSTTEKAVLVQSTAQASDVTGVSFNDLVAAMRSGGAYVNVHSTTFPGGEVRGQIRPVSVD